MLPDIFDNTFLTNLRAERLSSLAHAAECLAIAARAAAESFNLELKSNHEEDLLEDNATSKCSTYEDAQFSAVPPLNLILLNPTHDSIAPGVEPELDHAGEDREMTGQINYESVEGSIRELDMNELAVEIHHDTEVGAMLGYEPSVEVLSESSHSSEITTQEEHPEVVNEVVPGATSDEAAIPAESEWLPVIDPKQPYRILVDNEFDVLVSVCALIGKNQRVVCYMPSGTPPLLFYKQLIEGVTGVSAHFPERVGSARRDAWYKQSLEKDNSVALIPNTLSPSVVIDGENSWVIHVGWPSSQARYLTQINNHQAKNNVIIACSSDPALYPSSTDLMNTTQIWPKQGDLSAAALATLRQSLEDTLEKIPDEVKAKVYADLIQSHGVYGPRYVKAWDPVMLVLQANQYLHHVLQYGLKDYTSNSAEERPLPEVSPGFVAQNLLEPAVQAGVLHVKHHGSGLNHISSLAQADFNPPTPNRTRVDTPTTSTAVPHISGQPVSSEKVSEKSTRVATPIQPIDFKPALGHTYFTIEEEFDAMPLICFIAGKYDKTVCFLEGQGSLRHYQKLFSKILPSPFSVIAPEATNSDQANNDAALRFTNSPTPAMLLLTYSTTNLPVALREKRVGCCVYWGFHLPLKQAKKHRDQLLCSSTTMIISEAQQKEIKRQSTDSTEHPSAQILIDLGPKSLLWPMRNTTVSVLMAEEATIKGLYVNRIYGLGTVSRAERSAEEVVRMANRYAAKILLRGLLEDGSENFPPVPGRLTIPRTVVERFSLQPAINAGLALIG